MLTIAQRNSTIDESAGMAKEGQFETFKDGQRYKTWNGTTITARENGIREIETKEGKHYQFDCKDHSLSEQQPDGSYRKLSEA
ncbi:hypothetical protein ABTE74_19925, partial [Acinetobacter baumannii]